MGKTGTNLSEKIFLSRKTSKTDRAKLTDVTRQVSSLFQGIRVIDVVLSLTRPGSAQGIHLRPRTTRT